MNILIVVLMYGLWSSVFAVGKWTLQFCPPVFLTGFRMTLAGILLTGYLAMFKRGSFKINRKQAFSILILAVLSVYITNILEFWGLQYLTAAKTCFIYSLSPFFAALFSYLHFGEKMNRQKWLGMAIGFVGFIPVLMTQTGSEELFTAFSFFSWPELAVMGAALASIYGWVILRIVVKEHTISPLMANGSSMLLGGILAFIHSFFTESWSPAAAVAHLGPVTALSPFLKGTILMTVISNLICYNIYGMMLKKFTATFLSFMGLLSPIFASFLGWIVLGELPSWQIFLSTGVVSCGLWVVYRAELKQGYIAKKAASDKSVTSEA